MRGCLLSGGEKSSSTWTTVGRVVTEFDESCRTLCSRWSMVCGVRWLANSARVDAANDQGVTNHKQACLTALRA